LRDLNFTCLLPIYRGDNAANFAAAAASLARSTVPPTDTLICQDGDLSPDLQQRVEDWAKQLNARVVRNQSGPGLHHNLNHAANYVRTPWMARFDADDLNMPHRFELQIAHLRARPQITVLGGNIIEFWPDGKEQRRTVPEAHAEILKLARWRSPMNHMTTLFRTDLFLACGGYPNIPRKEDYGLWLAMINAGGVFENMNQDLVRARLGSDFYRRRTGWRNVSSEWKLYRIKRKTRGIGNPIAAAAFIARSAALTLSSSAKVIYRAALR